MVSPEEINQQSKIENGEWIIKIYQFLIFFQSDNEKFKAFSSPLLLLIFIILWFTQVIFQSPTLLKDFFCNP